MRLFQLMIFQPLNPLNIKKLFAIAPTIAILSTFLIKLLITPIFEDTFEPPIIQVIGFFLSFIIMLIASISFLKVGLHIFHL